MVCIKIKKQRVTPHFYKYESLKSLNIAKDMSKVIMGDS